MKKIILLPFIVHITTSNNWRFTANKDFPSLIDIKNESYKEITSLPLNDDNHYEISLNYPINTNFKDIENYVIDQNLSFSQVSSQQFRIQGDVHVFLVWAKKIIIFLVPINI